MKRFSIILILCNLSWIILLFALRTKSTKLEFIEEIESPNVELQVNNNSEFSKPSTFRVAETHVYDFDLRIVDLAPDGFTRRVWSVNGQYPGPTIEVSKGDRVIINVHNHLDVVTSIHSHGISQRETPWYDGAVGITQCGIPPNVSFTYNFTVDSSVGTYWYHAHYYAQYVDGLIGAFIVHDPDDPYLNDYDEEYTVILNDWHHNESSVLVDWYMSLDSGGDEPMPDIGLINGKNKYDCSLVTDGSQCVDVELENFTFVYGKRYRLRIINASAFAAFFFSIDNHYLDVIEVEGTYIEKYTVTCIPINAGQRYSVIVTADQEISNYWMRSAFHMGFYSSRPDTLEVFNNAIIHYEGADDVDPETQFWSDSTMLDWWDLDQLESLKPYYFEPLPENTHTLVLALSCTDEENEVSKALVNGSSFTPDYNISTLDRVYNKIQEYDSSQNIYSFIYSGQVVDVIIINYDGGEHPFHMHSHKFWVIGSERFFTDYGISPENLNLVDPIQRDTVTVPEAGWAIIRFIVDSPGVWAFHCHIEWHVEAGLVAQFVELPDMVAQMDPPEEWKNLCKIQNTTLINQNTSFSARNLLKRNKKKREQK